MNAQNLPRRSITAGANVAISFNEIYHVLIEKLWLILTCILAGLLLGFAYISVATRKYEGKATIQVEQTDRPVVTVEKTVQQEDIKGLEILKTIESNLQRRSLLIKVLRRKEFQNDEKLAELARNAENAAYEGALISLQKGIDAKLRRGTRLIDIAAEYPDPVIARDLANALADEYLKENFEQHSGTSENQNQYLIEEAQRMQEKLQSTQLQLQDFARFDDLRSRMQEQQRQLDMLGQRYLDKHPKIIQARALLQDLRKEFVEELRQKVIRDQKRDQGKTPTEAIDLSDPDKVSQEIEHQESRFNILTQELETEKTVYDSVLQRLKETGINKDYNPVTIRIVERSPLPVVPVKPMKLLIIAIALVGGSSFGIGFAYFLNGLDSSFRTLDATEEYLELSALGAIPEIRNPTKEKLIFEVPYTTDNMLENSLRQMVPKVQELKTEIQETVRNGKIAPKRNRKMQREKEVREKGPGLILVNDPGSLAAEGFRSLRASLKLLGKAQERRSFLFTSAIPGEGKSFVSSNFALSLAQDGARVLLIDADLRRPSIHQYFGFKESRPGVSEFLSGEVDVLNQVRKTILANLSVMPAGGLAPNPAELISCGEFTKLLTLALNQYDRVVIDSAPVNAVSDTLLICDLVQTVSVVVRAGKTPRKAVQRAATALRQAGAPLAGFVLNRLPDRSSFGRSPYYYYQTAEGYGHAYGNSYGASRRS